MSKPKNRADDWHIFHARDRIADHMHVDRCLAESLEVKEQFVTENLTLIVGVATLIASHLRAGGKIIAMGNGGSATDASHFVGEMLGKLQKDRGPLAAITLNDLATTTAISNDYGYEQVFSRQVKALAKPDDVVIGISTSGNSGNVYKALQVARSIGCTTIGILGGSGGKIRRICDHALVVKGASSSARCQETHIFLLHVLASLVEQHWTSP